MDSILIYFVDKEELLIEGLIKQPKLIDGFINIETKYTEYEFNERHIKYLIKRKVKISTTEAVDEVIKKGD